MKLNTKIQYSVVALWDIYKNTQGEEKTIRLVDISERQGISLAYLEQLSRKLRKAKIIGSQRGPGGGYKLIKDFDDISLYDIYKAVGENIKFDYTINDSTIEKNNSLALFNKLESQTKENLQNLKISDLPNALKEVA
jgi:Rrf2 family protein